MRPPVRLNSAELDALYGLPHAAQVMYVAGIRPFMDYASGLVGASNSPDKSISLQSLAEVLFVEPKQGRTGTGSRSRKQARVCVDVLVEAGLIESLSIAKKHEKRLIFKCVLAGLDDSAQEKQGTNRAHYQGTNQAQSEASNSNGLADSATHKQGTPDTPEQGTPPRDFNHINTHKPRGRVRETIPVDFEIDGDVLARLVRSGVPLSFAEGLLQEFINANESSGYTSECWPAEFVKYCIKQKRFKESWESRNQKPNGLRLVKGGESHGDGYGFNTDRDDQQACPAVDVGPAAFALLAKNIANPNDRYGIDPNAYIIIDPDQAPINGRPVLVKDSNDQLIIRRYEIVGRKCYLASYNERYEPIEMDECFTLLGRVTGSHNVF